MPFKQRRKRYHVKASSSDEAKDLENTLQLLNYRRNLANVIDVYDPQKVVQGISGRFYEVLKLLGAGGFGVVYECRVVNIPFKEPPNGEHIEVDQASFFTPTSELPNVRTALFAVKADQRPLKVELEVLSTTRGKRHFCTLIDSGVEPSTGLHFMVMTRLGPSLSDIQHKASSRRLSISTATRVAIQMLHSIQEIHDCGFIHRDVKPSNYAIGMASERRHRLVHLLDFGISRYFHDHEREPRPVNPWRGTLRYCPLNNHMGFDLSRRDDLESWFYAIVELLTGELPWHHIGRNMNRVVESEKRLARTTKRIYFLENCPHEYDVILTTIDRWGFFVKPDYDGMYVYLMRAMRSAGAHFSDLYDWETNTSLLTAKRQHDIMKPNKKERCRLKNSGFYLRPSAFGSHVFKRKEPIVYDLAPVESFQRPTAPRERPSDEIQSRTPDEHESAPMAEEADGHLSSNVHNVRLSRRSHRSASSPPSAQMTLSHQKLATAVESESEPKLSSQGGNRSCAKSQKSNRRQNPVSAEDFSKGGASIWMSGYETMDEPSVARKEYRSVYRYKEHFPIKDASYQARTAWEQDAGGSVRDQRTDDGRRTHRKHGF